jgi:2-oxo-4-hydroxy-4-carboxy-5-ureidoimidazoline decarboxylase
MSNSTPATLSLARVNAMSPGDFSRAFGAVYEHSPWIAERAFAHRPFRTMGDLHGAMKQAVMASSREEQLALLRAHPELAGREAKADQLTAHSRDEQRSAGLNALSPEEMARIAELNNAHAKKFGFPFIIAVRRATKSTIFSEFERRLASGVDEEMQACLEQVFLITELRVQDMVVE